MNGPWGHDRRVPAGPGGGIVDPVPGCKNFQLVGEIRTVQAVPNQVFA